ncbi:MAG TPA: hypothetical protein VNZ27_05635 [Rhodanobacter sp.]|jgi:hypothetical protein|nr:hypothetical protein [Rhodanobacter sp.]
MVRRFVSLLAGSCIALGVSASAGAQTVAPTSPQPQIFAPGSISGPSGVDCLTLTPDGATVFFDQQAGTNGMIMMSHRTGDTWSQPQIAPFSGQWFDHDPALAPDGSFLLFTSNRPDVAGGQPLHGGHLWRVDRRGNSWSAPIRLPDAVNSGANIYAPSVAAQGDVYFQRMDAPAHQFHLYRSAYRNGRYQTPVRLALGDPDAQEQDPAIAPDESFIVFDANYAGKDKPERLYIAFSDGDHWSTPIDLGDAVNRYQPWGSHLGPDARTLYFTSNDAMKVVYPRSPAQASKDLARMRAWDNGSNHIWSVPLAPWLDAHHAL